MSYADVLLFSEETWAESPTKANLYLNKTATWFENKRLTMNMDETVYMAYSNYDDSLPNDIDIERRIWEIEQVTYYKNLAVIIDNYLRWHKHIEFMINKTKYLVFVFSKLALFMDQNFDSNFPCLVQLHHKQWHHLSGHLNIIQRLQNE